MAKKRPTKRYWVDWEDAATRVGADGWSLAPDAPRRFTQRGFDSSGNVDGDGLEQHVPPPAPAANPVPARPPSPVVHPSHTEASAASGRQRRPSAPGDIESRQTQPRPQQAPPEAASTMDGKTAIVARPRSSADGDVVSGESNALVRADNPPEVAVATHNFPPDLAVDPRLILMREPDGARAASFRVLRHHVVQQGNPQVIVVTSARAGEGKTTCAVNLAMAFGECRRSRVLLIDGNLRRPQLAALFRFKPPWCFAEQLIEHRDQPLGQWSVVEIAPFGLHVAAANPRPEPLLDAPAFAFAMERLRAAGYDYIILDSPAVLGTAEVNLIQDSADGVLLTTRAGHSRRADLRNAIEQLAPAPILGVVVVDG